MVAGIAASIAFPPSAGFVAGAMAVIGPASIVGSMLLDLHSFMDPYTAEVFMDKRPLNRLNADGTWQKDAQGNLIADPKYDQPVHQTLEDFRI